VQPRSAEAGNRPAPVADLVTTAARKRSASMEAPQPRSRLVSAPVATAVGPTPGPIAHEDRAEAARGGSSLADAGVSGY
jgi:hypothetical protein